jgi:hypothetical protein
MCLLPVACCLLVHTHEVRCFPAPFACASDTRFDGVRTTVLSKPSNTDSLLLVFNEPLAGDAVSCAFYKASGFTSNCPIEFTVGKPPAPPQLRREAVCLSSQSFPVFSFLATRAKHTHHIRAEHVCRVLRLLRLCAPAGNFTARNGFTTLATAVDECACTTSTTPASMTLSITPASGVVCTQAQE